MQNQYCYSKWLKFLQKGIASEIYKEFMKMSVNVITMGNHTVSNKEKDKLLES